ncbi:hypothetical protein C7449_1127 [Mycoplana dimorpha]|uniref:Uncharacterized protein n=1 Tax=Mycoplana dimorpha TaxID=28320 RepID=A0A2T5ANX7_MYCDI|nr:hypothetical protein C7449_1127 [Mycoplana dimorpha]
MDLHDEILAWASAHADDDFEDDWDDEVIEAVRPNS